MKKFALITLICAAVMMVSAPAFAFDLGGYNGPVNLNFYGHSESNDGTYNPGTDFAANDPTSYNVNLLPTGETWAVISLQSITKADGSNTVLWSQTSDELIQGIMYGLYDWNITGDAVNGYEIFQVGGIFDLYITDTPWDPTQGTAGRDDGNAATLDVAFYNTVTNNGSSFISGVLTPGIVVGDTATTMKQVVESDTAPTSGDGFALGKITGGNYQGWFDEGIQMQYTLSDPVVADWDGVLDPGSIEMNAVPEPASMVMLSLGLVGAALRKKFFA